MFTDPAPTFAGRILRIDQAINLPPPTRPAGPPVLAQLPGPMTEPSADVAAWVALAGLVDGLVVVGGPEEVAACRRTLDSCGAEVARSVAVIWRGDVATASVTAAIAAGADGVIVRLSSGDETAAPGVEVVRATGAALGQVLARRAG